MDQHDYSTARVSFAHTVKLAPEGAKGWALLAEAACHDRQAEQSLDALKSLVRLDPAKGSALGTKLSRIWTSRYLIKPGLQAVQLAAQANPRSPEPDRMLAQIFMITGHRQAATESLVQLIRKNSFTRDDLIGLSAATPCKDLPEQRQRMLQEDPMNKSPLLQTARLQIEQSQFDEAERLLLELTKADPADAEAQGVLAELYALHLPEKFYRWHAELPVHADRDSRVWAARGRWLWRVGKIDSAIRCLHESLDREPEQLATTMLIGQLLKSSNELELGNSYSQRGLHLQRIMDLSVRMTEPRANDYLGQMIEELEAAGRLWEAWGWCVLGEPSNKDQRQWILDRKRRIQSRLHATLARTDRLGLPGQNVDWNRFPLPDWSNSPSDDFPKENFRVASDTEVSGSKIHFADRADEIGLDFRFVNSYTPAAGRMIFEAMGAGVAVLDFDRDNWPDLYFPQGNTSPSINSQGPSDQLYRNLQGEQYYPVTSPAGINERSYSQGVSAGDFNDDGFTDLYIANLGRNCLYRNNGDGTFIDVTDSAGLSQSIWTVSCAVADLNGDGFPELFDVNYLQGPDLLTGYCTDAYGRRSVCRPTAYDTTFNTVCLNLGDGRFLEQQRECGLDLPQGRGLGLVIADFNEDDRLDVFIANDMSANFLLINEQTSTDQPLHFRDEAVLRNVALDEFGLAQACMGIACADINRDQLPDLYVTNFARESNTLYLSQEGGFYRDSTQSADLRRSSFEPLGFGTQFLDADNDGWSDLAVVNGHIDEFLDEPFRMKAQFFRGQPDGRFEELPGTQAGELFEKHRLGRGLALLDWNRDGRLDFVATDLEEAVLLAENQTRTENRSLCLRLVGTRSNRDGIGAKVRICITDDEQRFVQRTAGDGYECSNEQFLNIGVGNHPIVAFVEVNWPSGEKTRLESLSTEQDWLLIEGRNVPVTLEMSKK